MLSFIKTITIKKQLDDEYNKIKRRLNNNKIKDTIIVLKKDVAQKKLE